MCKFLKFAIGLLVILFMAPDKVLSQGHDETLVERSLGRDVTEAVLRRISSSSIFSEDHSFLARLAYVESKFGVDNKTYRADYFGGIWQVEESVFRITQTNHSSLTPLHVAIKNRFGIDWLQVDWKRLVTPFYSGIAAALYFTRVPDAIPDTISKQADFWIKYYRPLGNRQQFIADSEDLRNQTKCRGKMDLCIVLDSSGSINQWNPANYARAKEFSAQMIESFTLDYNRIGMLVYSTTVRDIFPIRNNHSIAEMARLARAAPYLNQGTRTDLAIFRAVQMFNNTPIVDGLPRLLLVFTDGQSDRNSDIDGAVRAVRNYNLKPISIGIGNNINRPELLTIALGDSKSVFELTDFESLQDFLFEITSVACETPQRTTTNATYNDTLIKDEKRLYEVELPQEGITITVTINTGRTVGYWSRTERVPSAAVYDGRIDGSTYIAPTPRRLNQADDDDNDKNSTSIFVTIQGLEETNNYTLATQEGNKAGGGNGSMVQGVINFGLLLFTISFHIYFIYVSEIEFM